MAVMISSKQQRFISEQLGILAWAASVQRAKLYNPAVRREDRDTETFRAGILAYVERELLPQYVSAVAESAHIANIERLAAFGATSGIPLLGPLGYKFGVAQKLLNLLLKYQWCLGHVSEPPHCPVDRIVLDKTPLRGRLNWTEIVSPEQYMSAISALKQVAGPLSLSLAQWELAHYVRR
jgi:hypothetical protein